MKHSILSGLVLTLCLASASAQISPKMVSDALNDKMYSVNLRGMNSITDKLDISSIDGLFDLALLRSLGDRSDFSSGFINKVSVLDNIVGGYKNRFDVLNGFAGDNAGQSKRDEVHDITSNVLVFNNLLDSLKARLDTFNVLLGKTGGLTKRDYISPSSMLAEYTASPSSAVAEYASSPSALVDQINAVNALNKNRIETLNFLNRVSSVNRRSESEAALLRALSNRDDASFGFINDISVLDNIVGGYKNRFDVLNALIGNAAGHS